jgi:hypothetical protein
LWSVGVFPTTSINQNVMSMNNPLLGPPPSYLLAMASCPVFVNFINPAFSSLNLPL